MPVEGRGLSSRQTHDVVRDLEIGQPSNSESVQKLQAALHAKAKAEASYRFYVLYDKISREDILAHAYAQCRSNRGAPGVDGQDFAVIEAYGLLLRRERSGAVPAGGGGDPGGERHRHAAAVAEFGLGPLSHWLGQFLRPGGQKPDAPPLAA